MFSIVINKFKHASEPAFKPSFSIRIIFCILSLAFITLSCGSGAYEPEQNTSQDDFTNETTGSIYPHAAGFAKPDSHGQYTLANNTQSCGLCHGDDFQGGTSLISCFECHPPYPHRQGWNEPGQHGVSAQEIGIDSCAIMCHGENYSGKGSATKCFKCHELFPHNADWGNIENHGVYVIDNGTDNCQTACHGTDLSGGISTVSCSSCHDAYPHNSEWINMSSLSNHGKYVFDNGNNACANACHGTDYSGGYSDISCFTCHDPYPHKTGWADWDNHGTYVLGNGNNTCATACHGADFSGGDTGVKCIDCHKPYPHSADWTTVGNPSNHGRFYVESYVLPAVISNAECASNCHGTDFSGGGSTVSCDSCHDEGVFPHFDQGQILWNLTGHQNAVNITLGNDTVCTECHSDYLRGSDGGTLITCTTYCH